MVDGILKAPKERPAAPSIFPHHIRVQQRERLRRALARALADGFSGKIAAAAEKPKENRDAS